MLKSRAPGGRGEEKRTKTVHFEDHEQQLCQTLVEKDCQPTLVVKDGVFGSSLNKKLKRSNEGVVRGEGEEERKSVWKLRRWSRRRGYHTVVVNGEGERDGGEGGEKNDKETPKPRAASEEESKVHVLFWWHFSDKQLSSASKLDRLNSQFSPHYQFIHYSSQG